MAFILWMLRGDAGGAELLSPALYISPQIATHTLTHPYPLAHKPTTTHNHNHTRCTHKPPPIYTDTHVQWQKSLRLCSIFVAGTVLIYANTHIGRGYGPVPGHMRQTAAIWGSLKTTLCLADCSAFRQEPGSQWNKLMAASISGAGGGPHSHKLLISISQHELYDMQVWKCGILSFRGACSPTEANKVLFPLAGWAKNPSRKLPPTNLPFLLFFLPFHRAWIEGKDPNHFLFHFRHGWLWVRACCQGLWDLAFVHHYHQRPFHLHSTSPLA